jgi:hypothetical protein
VERWPDSKTQITMKKSIAVALCLGTIPSSIFALDLTPHEIAASKDGSPVQRFFFQDESKRMSFRIDNKMAVSGANDSAVFRFNDIKNAGVKLSKSRTNPEVLFDEKNLESYRAITRTFLPSEAKDPQIEDEKPAAIAINGWNSYQFVLTYKLFGFPYRRSITFLNYNGKEQLIFDVSAPESDYQKVYARGYKILNSLSDLSASNNTGPT